MPGVKSRFLPRESARLISLTPSAGLAMKKSEMGMDRPGVGPAAHVVPRLRACASGTNTLQRSWPSTRRNGFSRERGVVSRVVYGGSGYDCAGAPCTPAKTWFQTPLLHPPTALLRTRYCCWEPLTTVPVNSESAMKPPLAKDGGVQ